MPTTRIIMGIDPGFDRVGLGVIRETSGTMKWVHHACVQTCATQPFGERLQTIRDALRETIDRFRPDIAAVEQLFFTNNAKTAIRVGMARGVIMLVLADARIPVVEMTPNAVKQGLAGWGNADKLQMQVMIQKLLRLDSCPEPDDAADALAIAMVGARLYAIKTRLQAQGVRS